jgi:minor extracellular serine protease Vpr
MGMGSVRRKGAARAGTVAGVGLLATGLAVLGGITPAGQAQAATTAENPGNSATRLSSGRFHKAPAGSKITHQPRGLSNAKVTVMVELKGAPVAVLDAADPLTKAQKTSHRSTLRAKQKPTAERVRELGGTVLSDYQSAYNGLKVRISQKHVATLAALPNVVAVHRVTTVKPENVHGVPLIGGPSAWAGTPSVPGVHGEGIKVAVIDTGIDYTHADFGGPGTVAAFTEAQATSAAPANPAWFGPAAPKVKGGIDLVGDSYNADPSSEDYQPIPHPDPNPLDCDGHGTHVSGTAAGFGVLKNGKTYRGTYNANTITANQWNVGPGVAPKASLYAIRIFGCEGSSDLVVDAIEWAVEHDIDVINMSLGSPFGSADSPDSVAASNAAADGVIVVAASGNEGTASSPYMTGSPAAGSGVISVAASDPTKSYPGAAVKLSTGTTLQAVNANGADLPTGSLPVKVLMTDGVISLGCDPQEYKDANVEGALVVVRRGTCARVARAIYGQQAGAAAVLMVNNADSLPPYEGPITSNPDDGTPYDVTIPFLGVKSSDGAALIAANGGTADLSSIDLENPGYLGPASFTSGGPRSGDSWLKPDVTAPGVSIFSAGSGTGNSFAVISGTSMASPFTAGMAALVKQAHPRWHSVTNFKAAIVNTSNATKVAGYSTRVAGAGLIQAPPATRTQVVAVGDKGTASLNYGFRELHKDYVKTKTIKVRNLGKRAATFALSATTPQGSPHTVTLSRTHLRVPAHQTAYVKVRLAVPVATAGTSAEFTDVAGLIKLRPTHRTNHGVALSVPYYLVPQATSNISTKLDTGDLTRWGSTNATVSNRRGAVTGNADWYAWGLSDGYDQDLGSDDVQAVGAQSFPQDEVLAFAISTYDRWSNAGEDEFDIFVDVNGDGKDDYAVVAIDNGYLTAGDPDGQVVVAVFDLATGDGSIEFLADAPTNSTTMALPVLFSQLCTTATACLSASNPRITYSVQAYGFDGTTDPVSGSAEFNAFSPSLSTGMFATVKPNKSVKVPVTFDADEFKQTPALGFMVVSHDNPADDEAQLIKVRARGSN